MLAASRGLEGVRLEKTNRFSIISARQAVKRSNLRSIAFSDAASSVLALGTEHIFVSFSATEV